MKKSLFFLVILLAVLPSCSRQIQPTVKVGISLIVSGNRSDKLIRRINEEAALNGNVQYKIKINGADPERQVADIRALIDDDIDILVVAPNNDPAVAGLLKEIYANGVKIILLEGGNNDIALPYDTKVKVDNYEVGKRIADYLNSKYRGLAATGLIVRGKKKEFDEPRYEGFSAGLKQGPSNIGIAVELQSRENRYSAQLAMDEYLDVRSENSSLDSIDFVYAYNCNMAAGIKDSFLMHNYQSFPFIIGVVDSDDDECMKMIEDSYFDAAVIYTSIGDLIIKAINDIVIHNLVDPVITPQLFVLDRGNVALYRSQNELLGNKAFAIDTMASTIDSDKSAIIKQKIFIAVFIVCLLIVAGALVYAQNQFKVKQQLLLYAEEQNVKNKQQLEELQEQKNQLVELSKKLEESTQAKLIFFTNISHEFKTPLSLISGPISDLVKRKDFSPEVTSLLDIIYRNSNRLNRLITELIDFRIYEKHSMVINYSMGNVKDFLTDLSSLFSDVFSRRNISFEFEAPRDNDFYIPFDPVKLEKVFTNLMSNAINHVKDNGRIRVSLRVDKYDNMDSNLHLSVFNSDSFIPEERRKNIFRRFYTMDNSRGTGIGLALTTAIVDAFCGSIAVESDRNEGTKFLIDIPIGDNIVTDNTYNKTAYSPDFAKMKLATIDVPERETDFLSEMESSEKPVALVVEDNSDMRHYLKLILSNEFHVLLANDGKEGYEKAVKYRPEIIVSDIYLPEMDGFQLCLGVKSNDALKNIPIVLLTASSSDEQRAKGYECGADAYLQKPFNDQILKIRMKKLIEKQQDSGVFSHIVKSGATQTSLQLLEKFKEYVERHIDEEISVDDIAAYFSYSKSKLYRELKEVTEYSPVDVINLIRLRYAVDLMVNKNKNITETAFLCGFTSASYFSRVFQKYYNERPLAYVKRLTSTNNWQSDSASI